MSVADPLKSRIRADTGAEVSEQADRGSPSSIRRGWLIASPLGMKWLVAANLFACLFLPTWPGCDNEPIAPIDFVVQANSNSPQTLLCTELVIWPYLFGMTLLVGAGIVVIRGTENAYRTQLFLFGALIAVTFCASAAGLFFDPDDGFSACVFASSFLAMFVFVGVCLWRSPFVAAMWAQTMLATLSAIWFYLVASEFGRGMLYGGKLALAASVALLGCTALEAIYLPRLITTDTKPQPIQFSLRALIVASIIAGVGLGVFGQYLLAA